MNLLKVLATVSSLTFVSRILGFVRDTLIARMFGAGMETDAFFVAFKIPNMLRRISAEGAFSQAFVPILAEYRKLRSHEETHLLINHVAALMTTFLIGLTVLGMLAAPWVIQLTAPGFAADQTKFELTVSLLRITFPYIVFISLVSLAGGILNTYGHFSVPAVTPVWLNVAFIVAALWVAPYFEHAIQVLAWAVFVGGLIQMLYQLPYLRKIGLMPKWQWNTQDEGVWRILRLMGPALFGVSIAQISLLINTMFASFLASGSVSWLYYADRLMEFPTGLLGVALGTILLPSLSKSVAEKQGEEYSLLLDWGLRLTLMLAMPAAVALAVLALPLVSSLFFYGAFETQDVEMTRQALAAYAVGLLGLILIKVLAPAFYARQDIKTPVRIAVKTLLLTQLLNLVLVLGLGFNHSGLALSISLGACANALWLFLQLRRGGLYQPQAGWLGYFVKLCMALGMMTAVLFLLMGSSVDWLHYALSEKVIRLGMLLVAGMTTYFGSLWLLGLRVQDFVHRTRQ